MDDPFLITALLPLLISLALASPWLALSRERRLRGMAAAAPGLALLAALLIIIGVPLLPPVAAAHKFIVLVPVAALVAALLTVARASAVVTGIVLLLLWGVGVCWLGQRLLAGSRWAEPLAAIALGAVVLLWLLRSGTDVATAFVQIVLGATGLSVVALLSSSASLAQMAGALAAACGALVLLEWPRPRLALAPAAPLAMAVVLGWLAAQAAFFSSVGVAVMAPLLLVFVAGWFGQWLLARWRTGAAWAPLLATALAAPALAVAILLAW